MLKMIVILLLFINVYSQDKIFLNNENVIESKIEDVQKWGLITDSTNISFKVIKNIQTRDSLIVEKLDKIIPDLKITKIDDFYNIEYKKENIPFIESKSFNVIKHIGFAINGKVLDKHDPIELQLNSYSMFDGRIFFQVAFSINALIREEEKEITSFSLGLGYIYKQFNFVYKLKSKHNMDLENGIYSAIEINFRIMGKANLKFIPGIGANITNIKVDGKKNVLYFNLGFEYKIK